MQIEKFCRQAGRIGRAEKAGRNGVEFFKSFFGDLSVILYSSYI